MFVSGILNKAPIAFAIIAEAISITEPFRKLCFFKFISFLISLLLNKIALILFKMHNDFVIY